MARRDRRKKWNRRVIITIETRNAGGNRSNPDWSIGHEDHRLGIKDINKTDIPHYLRWAILTVAWMVAQWRAEQKEAEANEAS